MRTCDDTIIFLLRTRDIVQQSARGDSARGEVGTLLAKGTLFRGNFTLAKFDCSACILRV